MQLTELIYEDTAKEIAAAQTGVIIMSVGTASIIIISILVNQIGIYYTLRNILNYTARLYDLLDIDEDAKEIEFKSTALTNLHWLDNGRKACFDEADEVIDTINKNKRADTLKTAYKGMLNVLYNEF